MPFLPLSRNELFWAVIVPFLRKIIDFVLNFKKLHKALLYDDKKTFYEIVNKLDILKEDISDKSKQYMFEYFK